ncbi:MAG: DUF2029 domain-containing protein [Acidobacteria bacterium]|nr:DUF2029 domain-containing protein [Acidobacteriota bacterium]
MGAVILRAGRPDALYPTPFATARRNPGWPDSSRMHPAYEELARRAGVGNTHRFVHPPPMALLLWPLSFLPYDKALWAWSLGMGMCAWGTCLLSGRIHAALLPREHAARSALILLAAFSPLMMKTLRGANITPLVSLALALGLSALIRGSRNVWGAIGIVVAGLGKGVGALLLPLAFVRRQWRILMWTLGLSAAILLASLLVMGIQPFLDFLLRIMPAMNQPDPFNANQSLYGFLFRARAGTALPPGIVTTVRAVGYAALTAALVLVLLARQQVRESAPHLCAAAALLTALSLVFSPFAWDHYSLYLVPAWAWLFWEARQSRGALVCALLAIALIWCPLAAIRDGSLVRWMPAQSHMLLGHLLCAGLATRRLCQRRPGPSMPMPS